MLTNIFNWCNLSLTNEKGYKMFSDDTMIVYGAMKKAQNGMSQQADTIRDLDRQIDEWKDWGRQKNNEIDELNGAISSKDAKIAELESKLEAANKELEVKTNALEKQTDISKALMCKSVGLGQVCEFLMKALHKVNPEHEAFIQDSTWEIATSKTKIGDKRMRLWEIYEKGVTKTCIAIKANIFKVSKII